MEDINKINILLTSDEKDEFKIKAVRERKSVSEIVRILMRMYLDGKIKLDKSVESGIVAESRAAYNVNSKT